VARELDVAPKTIRTALKRAAADPAMEAAKQAVGTGLEPALAWIKTKPTDDLPGYSVLLKPAQEAVIPLEERLAEAFANIQPVASIPTPTETLTLLNVTKAFDWHLGQHSWGRETGGQDYDLALGDSDLRQGIVKLMQRSPRAAESIIIFGGDNLHVDDSRAETPAHRNKLDADGRYQKIVDTGVDAMAFACDSHLAMHEKVTVVVLRGNHDPHAHIALRTGLRQRYRENPRMTVWAEPFDIFWRQFGRVGIFANHGDRSKPIDLTLEIAAKCPFYSAVEHRHLFTGHRHRESAQQLPGMMHEGLGPVAPADAYGARFSGRRTMYCSTFDADQGMVARAYDTLTRPPPQFGRAA
jgi:hypothetical protein